jgi:hypothetical protein
MSKSYRPADQDSTGLMKAVGMANDHVADCFRFEEIVESYKRG